MNFTAGPATAPPYGFIPSAFARGSWAITSTTMRGRSAGAYPTNEHE